MAAYGEIPMAAVTLERNAAPEELISHIRRPPLITIPAVALITKFGVRQQSGRPSASLRSMPWTSNAWRRWPT